MGCLKLEEKSRELRVVYKKDTAHEHFYEQDIIHMNGRIYDPKLRMFLSPDINLLDPSDSKHYNRYAYALNNPLMYSDPSGNEIITLAALGTAALVGAIIGGISYSALACYYGNFSWNNLAKNVVTSAVTSAVMATGMGILKDLFLFPQGGATALSRANEAMSNGVSNFLGDTGHSIAQAGTQGAAFTGYTAASIMNNSINTSASFASYTNVNANLFNASNYSPQTALQQQPIHPKDVLGEKWKTVSYGKEGYFVEGIRERPTWVSKNRIFQWDSRHGTLEVYNKARKHIGEIVAKTGKFYKGAQNKFLSNQSIKWSKTAAKEFMKTASKVIRTELDALFLPFGMLEVTNPELFKQSQIIY